MDIFFDIEAGLYKEGDLHLPRSIVRGELERIMSHLSRRSRQLARQLSEGVISLSTWQRELRDIIRTGHILAAALGYGGTSRITTDQWKDLGRALRVQYLYLNQFARQIEEGKVILEAQWRGRSDLYIKSLRATYYLGEASVAMDAGYEQSRRVLHALETCSQCRKWAGMGFIPISDQPPIGTLNCGQFCRCTFSYQ